MFRSSPLAGLFGGLSSNSRKAMPTLVIVAANVKVLATSGADGKLARSNTTL